MLLEDFSFFSDKGRGFFIDLRTGDLYKLNPTAIRIFDALKSGVGRDQLPGIISSEFDVGFEQAKADIQHFIEKLQSLGELR